jgi:hypothetical protein
MMWISMFLNMFTIPLNIFMVLTQSFYTIFHLYTIVGLVHLLFEWAMLPQTLKSNHWMTFVPEKKAKPCWLHLLHHLSLFLVCFPSHHSRDYCAKLNSPGRINNPHFSYNHMQLLIHASWSTVLPKALKKSIIMLT